MPLWVKLVLEQVLKLITPELVDKVLTMAKQFAVDELRRAAKATKDTDLDDAFVEKVAKALGVK